MRATSRPPEIQVSTDMTAYEPCVESPFDEHRDEILRYLVRRLDRAQVVDALADVAAVADRSARSAPRSGRLLWLYSIAARVVSLREPPSHGPCSRHRGLEAPTSSVGDEVCSAVDALDAQEREVLRLRAWEGLGVAQIAVVTGLNERSVRSILADVCGQLRDVVETCDEDAADDSMWMPQEVGS
jgi:DNA-directed RNA polymerase specialized sigma24 family protein